MRRRTVRHLETVLAFEGELFKLRDRFFLWPARVQMRTAGVSNQLDTFAVREDSKLDTFALGSVVPNLVQM